MGADSHAQVATSNPEEQQCPAATQLAACPIDANGMDSDTAVAVLATARSWVTPAPKFFQLLVVWTALFAGKGKVLFLLLFKEKKEG